MVKHRIQCDVAVVGGGVAGLSLATELKRLGIEDVLVIEREASAGGVPRHCGHYPFGWREFKRVLKGPEYAARIVADAQAMGVRLRTGTSVNQLHQGGRLSLSDHNGVCDLYAKRVVLCTGAREGTRAQRFLGGHRPQGILPTGAVQSMAYLHAMRPFNRPVILGTELVSMSAIMTCKHMAVRPVAILEENSRTTVPTLMRAYPLLHRIPLYLQVRDVQIHGKQHVHAVEFTDATGKRKSIEADGVIVSGQFRPESALLRGSHLEIDPATGGPVVDQFYRTSDPAYYCSGNLLRPVESSTWCWEEGRATARTLANHLLNTVPEKMGICLNFEFEHPALKLVVPQKVTVSKQPSGMDSLQLRVNEPVNAQLVIKSADDVIWSGKLNALPERRRLIPIQPLLAYAASCKVNTAIQLCLEG